MARDIRKEQHRLRTGNRFVQEPGESTGVFPRDIDALFVQYTNLRNKVYATYSPKYSSKAMKEELKSYIDEEFVKLCKEYEINGEIDFPYYIKTKLNSRVRGSFNSRSFKRLAREPLGATDETVSNLLDARDYVEDSTEISEYLDQITKGITFTEMEYDMLVYIVTTQCTPSELYKVFSSKYDLPQKEIKETFSQIQELVKHKLGLA